MQLSEATRTVSNNLHGQTSAFTIAANAQAFKVLSSNLYSNRPLAIIRELCSNAWDAHERAGKAGQPIRVTTPSMVSHNLVIRDFGPGLSHNNMISLYTRMFGTDKGDSNDEIGGLGLGSKSPLSYTDQFTVSSYHKGTMRTYSAFLDEAGMPQITLLTEQSTNETGLEVIVPSSAGHGGARFLKEAEEFLKTAGFPAMLNGELVKQVEPVFEWVPKNHPNLKVKVLPHWRPTNGATVYAQMGPVLYPMHGYNIRNLGTYRTAVVIEMPIGHVDIAPSREAISPTRRQDTYLTDLTFELGSAYHDDLNFENEVVRKLNAANTPYQMYDVVEQLRTVCYRIAESRAINNSRHGAFPAQTGSPYAQLIYWNCTKARWLRSKTTKRSVQVFEDDYQHNQTFAVIANPEGRKAYKHHARELFQSHNHVMLFNGTIDEAKAWVKKIGFPDELCTKYEELTKPEPKPKGQKRTYGSTRYTCQFTTLHRTADEIMGLAAETDSIVMVTDYSTPDSAIEALKTYLPPDIRVYLFEIPEHHNKVKESLGKDGCIRSIRELLDQLDLPEHIDAVIRSGNIETLEGYSSREFYYGTWAPVMDKHTAPDEGSSAIVESANYAIHLSELASLRSAFAEPSTDEKTEAIAREEHSRAARQLSYWVYSVCNYYGVSTQPKPPINLYRMRRAYHEIQRTLIRAPSEILQTIQNLHEECDNA